jgi:hypothetical protein
MKTVLFTKTRAGGLIEIFIGVVLLIIALPFMIICIIGKGCEKLLDFVGDKDDQFCNWLAKKGW